MGKLKYTAGMKLGKYNTLLIERTKRVGRNYYGIFQCSFCGKNFETRIAEIVNGKCKSCGCQNDKQRKITGKNNSKDLTNKRFGYLIAIKPTEERQQRKIKWLCQCDCGKQVLVASSDLINGHTKSCGCLKSGGELQIRNILLNKNICFEQEKIFNDCYNPNTKAKLRFDFYLPDYNCCIECHGNQHYKSIDFFGGEEAFKQRQYLDTIKEEYCKNNNIKLIVIPYKNYGDIAEEKLMSLIL